MALGCRNKENKYRAIDTASEYAELFRDSGEASRVYFLPNTDSAERISADIPDAKLIAILRDRSERAYSAYLHMIRDGHEKE